MQTHRRVDDPKNIHAIENSSPAKPAATPPAVNTPQPGTDDGVLHGSPGPNEATITPASAGTADPEVNDPHGGKRGSTARRIPGRSEG